MHAANNCLSSKASENTEKSISDGIPETDVNLNISIMISCMQMVVIWIASWDAFGARYCGKAACHSQQELARRRCWQ